MPHVRAPSTSLQHRSPTKPSPSRSKPTVVGSQSSSWASASQTSALPGKRFGSSSSQSLPPHAMESTPSRSRSPSEQPPTHSSTTSSQRSAHGGAVPGRQPSAFAAGSVGSHDSSPLQKSPSSQSVDRVQVVPPSPPGATSSPHPRRSPRATARMRRISRTSHAAPRSDQRFFDDRLHARVEESITASGRDPAGGGRRFRRQPPPGTRSFTDFRAPRTELPPDGTSTFEHVGRRAQPGETPFRH